MKKIYLLLLVAITFIPNFMWAQQDTTQVSTDSTTIIARESPFSLGADIMSRYVWRGTQFGGNSPSIQPSLSVSYKNFTFGVWGAYSTGGVHASQELDLYLSGNFINDMFTVVVTDYYFPSDTASYHYMSYDSKTGHVLETGVVFNGTDNFPISLSAYVNVYGHDARKVGDDPSDTTTFNQEQDIQFSNYFEVSYSKSFKNNFDINAFLGFTLSNPKKADANTGYIGESGFYGNGPGVVNLGLTASKSVKITNSYSMPLTASFIINPQAERVYLVFGISF